MIIDDGSTDDTAELVNLWKNQDNGFEIEYIYKENGGMHTAHNVAFENIKTELCVCVDSDDYLIEDAVFEILSKWATIRDKGFAGLMGLNIDFRGNIIGTDFPIDLQETTVTGYYSNGGSGDKKLIYRTDVIKSYPPYPIFCGETYVALAYKYRLIDQDYKMSVLNKPLCVVEYLSDGSTKTMWKHYNDNPKGFAFWRKVCLTYPTTKKRMILDCIHYVSSSILSKNLHFITESPKKLLTLLVTPIGFALSLLIKFKSKK